VGFVGLVRGHVGDRRRGTRDRDRPGRRNDAARARWSARGSLVTNALVALLVAYQVFDEIRMSYFPSWSWPF
jgi:hypothetical protein